MQFNEEKAIKILTDELSYAYCDNCANSINSDENYYCDECHRKYSSWALDKDTAAYIIDRIIKEC